VVPAPRCCDAPELCGGAGVFDGHGPLGRAAARFAREAVPNLLRCDGRMHRDDDAGRMQVLSDFLGACWAVT
jgi:hypothetical protein